MHDFIHALKERNRIKNETRSYLKSVIPQSDYEHCLAISLTMKQGIDGFFLDQQRASQNFRHFMNVLNRKIYGKRFQRFSKRLSIAPTLEHSSSGRLHYHALIKCPTLEENGYSKSKLCSAIKTTWPKTAFGSKQMEIESSVDEGWIDYITKFLNVKDDFDWQNFNWN